MIKNFYSLTKPGIVYGNLVTAIGGFFLGSRGVVINYFTLLATLLGIALIIACGCVFNNYIDRDIDGLMKRTQNRVLVKELISGKTAIIYAVILGALGLILLLWQTNLLTVSVALVGLFVYVVLYSLLFKRNSIHGTIIGSISGAVPVLVGYCAVTNQFDIGATLLFLILAIWQMPHSYAIGICLLDDYSIAKIQILPVKKGIYYTKVSMLFYVIMFLIVALMLTLFGYTGISYLIVMGLVGFIWVALCASGFRASNNKTWARKMFICSILIIVIFSVMIAVSARAPI
ncbi:MAG: heme o synthase [Proteobacteria bacterium]|nr:heme o synthase [Pseudomonadota bacterium]